MFRLARGLSPSSYRREWLAKDVVAGIVLSTLLVPQGMAYAELAGLPPITGLYTSILCLLGYAAFGPSRLLVLGPDSSLGPMIAATILPLIAANGDPDRAIALASMLAILVAAIVAYKLPAIIREVFTGLREHIKVHADIALKQRKARQEIEKRERTRKVRTP